MDAREKKQLWESIGSYDGNASDEEWLKDVEEEQINFALSESLALSEIESRFISYHLRM